MRTSQNGFTLVETIAAITIMGIVGTITIAFLSSASNTFRLSASEQALHEEAWAAVERMVREVRSAVPPQTVPPAPPRLSPITLPAAGASGNVLSFDDIQKNDPAICAKCVDRSTAITYSHSGNSLMRTGDMSGPHVIASHVTAFMVRHDPNGVVSVQLSLSDGSAAVTLSASSIPFFAVNPNYTPHGVIQ